MRSEERAWGGEFVLGPAGQGVGRRGSPQICAPPPPLPMKGSVPSTPVLGSHPASWGP